MTIHRKENSANQVSDTIDLFLQRYGVEPKWISAAPGRVNLIGDHVDYNGGLVLPFAIDKYSVVAASLIEADSLLSTIYSVQLDASFELDANAKLAPARSGWHEYIKGVIHGFQSLGTRIPAMQILINSSVPTGSGLSSSAALEVSIATLLESVCEQSLDKKQKALLCQTAENDFANVPCGVMDQFISVFGQKNNALLLDCRDLSFRQVPLDQSEVALLIINSNASHELASSEYAIRRKNCESACRKLNIESLRLLNLEALQNSQRQLSELEFQRARHVVTENARTLAFAKHLENKEWKLAGDLMYQSHKSLKSDYEVSCLELDVLVSFAREIGLSGGVYGSRMTGGGFGGSTVTLVKRDMVDQVAREIVERYDNDEKIAFQATAFHTHASDGAHLIEYVPRN